MGLRDFTGEARHTLKIDLMAQWIDSEWTPYRGDDSLLTLWIPDACADNEVLTKYDNNFELPDGYRLGEITREDCPVVPRLSEYSHKGGLTYRTGGFLYHFVSNEDDQPDVEVLVLSSFYSDHGYRVTLGCLPTDFLEVWTAFSTECSRLASALSPTSKVVIVGGNTGSFVPTVDWDEVVLPHKLKADLLEDVESFFTKGIDIYKRLNLKPFRKLLLAGVPGTGKTMLCSALAKWSIEREYLVIYISSGDRDGSSFYKIEHALAVASHSKLPTLIILEELDAYLHEEEKALVLNVLDGSESSINDMGTLLIATTNYPEAIDERVLKRPGRLDRVFIVPEIRDKDSAEKMLRQYLGQMWQDDHRVLVPKLVGYPGAFIREVAIYALTQVAYGDLDELSPDLLERSFAGLEEQIAAKDDFLSRRKQAGVGFTTI